MLSYALSAGSFGSYITPAAAEAVRRSNFRNYEYDFGTFARDEEKASASAALTRNLIGEGVFRCASIHLPFYGKQSWDPSCLDETARKEISARFVRLIREHGELLGPMATLHASVEPPLSEHPQRLDQACKTIEEMLPAAREAGIVINVEFLPRTCVGNCAEELQQIVSRFDPGDVGICLDVNHIMNRYRELPAMIDLLAPRIRSFHISDYDGIDETHWMPGQGIHDWPEIMKHIRAIDHDVLLILETTWQLTRSSREIDPLFALKQNERACWFLENCETILPQINAFRLPGN